MVMTAQQLSAYVDPILEDPTLAHVATIRFGTKAVAYWPYRFVTDPDADATLRLFQRIVESGRHVSIMSHFSHPNELSGPVPQVIFDGIGLQWMEFSIWLRCGTVVLWWR